MYQEFFEFEPTFKIFLAANHKPTISGTDPAIWDRIKIIPFPVRIPINERNKSLKGQLKLELSGILNWAVQGCLEWQKSGLMPPTEVSLAIEEYKSDMDILGGFIEDCYTITPHSRISKTDFYIAYENWCGQNREQPISIKAFGKKLKERGTKDGKSGNIRYWNGIGLRG